MVSILTKGREGLRPNLSLKSIKLFPTNFPLIDSRLLGASPATRWHPRRIPKAFQEKDPSKLLLELRRIEIIINIIIIPIKNWFICSSVLRAFRISSERDVYSTHIFILLNFLVIPYKHHFIFVSPVFSGVYRKMGCGIFC